MAAESVGLLSPTSWSNLDLEEGLPMKARKLKATNGKPPSSSRLTSSECARWFTLAFTFLKLCVAFFVISWLLVVASVNLYFSMYDSVPSQYQCSSGPAGSMGLTSEPTLTANWTYLHPNFPRVIWLYWDSGFETAPLLVQKSLARIQKLHPHWTVQALDAQSARRFLASGADQCFAGRRFLETFTDDFMSRNGLYHPRWVQMKADILRLKLIEKYGGVWFDASSVLTQPLEEWDFDVELPSSRDDDPSTQKLTFKEVLESHDMVSFDRPWGEGSSPLQDRLFPVVENFFIAAKAHSPVVRDWLQKYEHILENFNQPALPKVLWNQTMRALCGSTEISVPCLGKLTDMWAHVEGMRRFPYIVPGLSRQPAYLEQLYAEKFSLPSWLPAFQLYLLQHVALQWSLQEQYRNKGLAGLMVDSDTSYSSNSGTNTTAAPGQYRIFHISEFKGPIQIQMVRSVEQQAKYLLEEEHSPPPYLMKFAGYTRKRLEAGIQNGECSKHSLLGKMLDIQ